MINLSGWDDCYPGESPFGDDRSLYLYIGEFISILVREAILLFLFDGVAPVWSAVVEDVLLKSLFNLYDYPCVDVYASCEFYLISNLDRLSYAVPAYPFLNLSGWWFLSYPSCGYMADPALFLSYLTSPVSPALSC